MIDTVLYRTLVPDAPLHRRTDGDPGADRGRERQAAVRSATPPTPGLEKPRLTSSWQGRIEQLLLSFPAWATGDPATSAAYRSVLAAMRRGTRFVVVHAASQRALVEEWFTESGHTDVTYVPLPDYVSFTDWAEDAYVALTDASDGTAYLVEPWEFLRAGDALIADAVEEHTGDVRAAQAPLVFQGGNCLIGDEFWLMGTDYFADTVALLQGGRPPVAVPDGADLDAFVRGLFHDYVDAGRELRLVGTRRPIPVRDLVGRREGDSFFLDLPSDGVGAYQPIFHIDMFVTLVGRRDSFTVLVGDPSMADDLLGTDSPYGLASVYDSIASMFVAAGMDVVRNPLVHRPTLGRPFTVAQLRALAERDRNAALLEAVGELTGQGAAETTTVRVRSWHHVTWNNCLVEDSATAGRHVYLPTYGGGEPDLAPLDAHTAQLWEGLGYTVHPLADFGSFARRQGVVHCIKKYLRRGD